jgi:hypothetical protein
MLSEKCDALPMNFASIGAAISATGDDTEPDATLSVVMVVATSPKLGLANEGVGVGVGVASIVVVRRSSGSVGVAISSRAALA